MNPTLDSLLEHNLKDIYSAEQQLMKALPDVATAAYSEELEEVISSHLEQTKTHIERLDVAFEELGIGKNIDEECLAMKGLIDELKRTIGEFERSAVRDSALIIGIQKIEHYEIASYGSLTELADVLEHEKIGDLLELSLEEEEEADELLSDLAQDINDEAREMSMQH